MLRTTTFLLFIPLFFLSCSTVQPQPKKSIKGFLMPLKLRPENKSFHQVTRGDYDLSFRYSDNLKAEITRIEGKDVLHIAIDTSKHYLYEIFDSEFLVVSEYQNLNAAAVEYMLRKKVYFASLKDDSQLYQLVRTELTRILIAKELLDSYKNSDQEDQVYCISRISTDSIFFLKTNGKVHRYPLKKLKMPYLVK